MSAGGRAARRSPGLSFSTRELRDLAAAWLALGVAFTFLIRREVLVAFQSGTVAVELFLWGLALSMPTVGVGFLLHELAHKVVAVRFGRVAAFQADYGFLFLAVMSGVAGFLFAAPGAVVHGGRRITPRESGLISVAGPVTNLLLAAVFLPVALLTGGFLAEVGTLGVTINLLLAGFNMLPIGPLDGRSVLAWSKPVYLAVAVPSVLLAALALFGPGI